MFSRTAVVVPMIVATAVLAVILTLLATKSRSAESRGTPASDAAPVAPAPAASALPVPSVASATPAMPPPPAYVRPVGNQYLGEWGRRLATGNDGPPRWFLLSAADLASNRYGWELPRLSEAMAEELGAVLDEGCRGHSCTAEIERARASVRTFVDDDLGTRTFGAPRVRRWTTDDDVHEEHRRIAITGRVDATTFDVECTCTSWTVGMRMWNDIAECEATLRDHGRTLLRYTPVTKRGSGKQVVFFPLDAYDQVVTLASGASLTIESGYAYEGDDVRTPAKRGAPRGAMRWASEPATR